MYLIKPNNNLSTLEVKTLATVATYYHELTNTNLDEAPNITVFDGDGLLLLRVRSGKVHLHIPKGTSKEDALDMATKATVVERNLHTLMTYGDGIEYGDLIETIDRNFVIDKFLVESNDRLTIEDPQLFNELVVSKQVLIIDNQYMDKLNKLKATMDLMLGAYSNELLTLLGSFKIRLSYNGTTNVVFLDQLGSIINNLKPNDVFHLDFIDHTKLITFTLTDDDVVITDYALNMNNTLDPAVETTDSLTARIFRIFYREYRAKLKADVDPFVKYEFTPHKSITLH